MTMPNRRAKCSQFFARWDLLSRLSGKEDTSIDDDVGAHQVLFQYTALSHVLSILILVVIICCLLCLQVCLVSVWVVEIFTEWRVLIPYYFFDDLLQANSQCGKRGLLWGN